MPNKDKTGPNGEGAKTGRQMGNCQDTKPNVDQNSRPCGRGCGRGRGFRKNFQN